MEAINGNEHIVDGFEIAKSVVHHFRSPETLLLQAYPSLFKQGIPEGSLHSFVLSALLVLGDHLGFSAICDSPVFDSMSHLMIGEGYKRPDSVWFERGLVQIRALFEFEKYKPGSLEAKIKNLLIMSKKDFESLNLLCLIYWTDTVHPLSDLEDSISLAKHGFTKNRTKFDSPNCLIVVIETLVKSAPNGIAINSLSVRSAISNCEEKQYLVEKLNSIN